jgi:diguanylate cyclase
MFLEGNGSSALVSAKLRRQAYTAVLVFGSVAIGSVWLMRQHLDPFVRFANPIFFMCCFGILLVALDARRPVELVERLGYLFTVVVVLVQTFGLYLVGPSSEAIWSAFSGVQQASFSVLIVSHMLLDARSANASNAIVLTLSALISAPFMLSHSPELVSAWVRFVLSCSVLGAFLHVLASNKVQLARERILSATDALTGAANRRKVSEELERSLEGGVSVILYDLDDFKGINDAFGHNAGDAVLRDSTAIAREVLEASGVQHVTLGRWGGEEFLIVLPLVSLDEADALAETLRQRFAAHRFSVPATVTASFGVARRLDGESPGQLVRRADQALYQAKFSGRNIVWTSLRHHTTGMLEVN